LLTFLTSIPHLPLSHHHSSGWKTALETISANNKPTIIEREREPVVQQDSQALADMQGRWSRSELALQLKLEEVQHKVRFFAAWMSFFLLSFHANLFSAISDTQQAMSDQELSALQILAMRRRMKLGDLEDDDEPPRRVEAPAPAPATPGLDTGLFMGRIERVEHQTTYTSIDVERMRAELDELKRLMALRPEPTPVVTPVHVPSPVKPKELKMAPDQQDVIKTRANKWDTLQNIKAATAPEPVRAPEPKVAPKAVVFELEPAPKPVVVKVEEPVKVTKPEPKPEPRPEPKPVPVVVEEPPAPLPLGDVDVNFPAVFNPELSVLLFSKEDFRVTVPADIPVDDLLFELRKAASTKVSREAVLMNVKSENINLLFPRFNRQGQSLPRSLWSTRASAPSSAWTWATMPLT
jgi:hypothetical protein